jgi:carbonic anhydrase/acetyltransferase-like protein (isoleucine patch superfamily)/AmiR/NasT family two-component response regulator
VSAYFGVGNFEAPTPSPDIDTDGDNIPDWWENLPWYNPPCKTDYNDPADNVTDFDGDGLFNFVEYQSGSNPCLYNNDSDMDGMEDVWEVEMGLNKWDETDALVDIDSDGLINYHEYLNGTDIYDPDTDNDNLPDGWEANNGLNPLNQSDATLDNDTDNLDNLQEYNKGTNPQDPDTDGDGQNDDVDACPTDASNTCVDQDGDGIPDAEDSCPTDASNSCNDSDGDGIVDSLDACPEFPDPTNACGDSDGDGVLDTEEPAHCLATPEGELVDIFGCSGSQSDSDGDNINDLDDQCPGTPSGYSVDGTGCITDFDGDGVNDAIDQCPNTPSGFTINSTTGCIVDTDGDTILDNDEPSGCVNDNNTACGTGIEDPSTNVTGSRIGHADVKDSASVLGSAVVSEFADITDNAIVNGSARVSGFADVMENAIVSGTANVTGNSTVAGNATVSGSATVKENALINDTATVTDATVSGSAVVSGNATVTGESVVTDNATVTGNSTLSDSTISGDSTIGGSSDVLLSTVNDSVVFDSFIDPSNVTDSSVKWSFVKNSIVKNNTDLQYAKIENITISNNKIVPIDQDDLIQSEGKIKIENVNFTITSNNLGSQKDYRKLVDGHKRSTNLTVNESGKTLKISDEDSEVRFAEIKIITNDSVTVNVTVAKVAINPKGGEDLSEKHGDYLSIEEEGQGLSTVGINPNTTIKIYYNPADFGGDEELLSSLLIYYYDENINDWTEVSSSKRGADATGSYVLAKVGHFSIFGLALRCGLLQKWCDAENSCIPLSATCGDGEPGPGPGVGGGPPAPKPPPPPVFAPEVTRLTDQLIIDLFLKGDWANRDFWTVPISVAPSLVLTDELPSPISPLVRGLLVKPIKMLLEPLKVFRGESVKSKEAINDIYRFTTEKVLAKYTQSDVVVIAVREPAVDSMAAVAFAKSQDAPILLTEHDEAPEATINAVRKLNPERIVIVGGTVAISGAVEAEFEKIAPTERIWGPTRYETAVELAERLDPDMVVITDGEDPYQDAVLVAAEYKAPIIYVRGKEIPDSTRDFLVKHIKTQEGNQMPWVTAGIDEDAHTEIQGLYTLPDFLTRNRLSLKLFQFGTRFLR